MNGPSEWRNAGAGLGRLPVFGPTDPFGDGETTPDVIVRVDFLLSREQLVTALGISWAEVAGDRAPESLTVVEARYEIESYLAVQAFHELADQMERDQRRVFPPDSQRAMQVLAEVVNRAYPVASAPAPVVRQAQAPRYGDGTVTLQTLDHGEIVVNEPAWCVGHDGETVGHRADITHNGAWTAAELDVDGDTVEFLPVRISHAPLTELQPEPRPVADVEGFPALDAEQLRDLAGKVGAHAGRLYSKANELDRLRRAES
ncbi:hypothetical protein PV726_06165 [Streptomyces europaeiscabiei]|uniref:DUF6907 domain-containing protein n=1 Tax=Streptomyces europaeiscabiei TaxID=146819 RepID=UPI0029ADF8BC|nr:hypothetical protein [Streptomyces europaeiscabiei]MDX3689927.1 hypothetical protein [Streptomyces europaeiscabiei]